MVLSDKRVLILTLQGTEQKSTHSVSMGLSSFTHGAQASSLLIMTVTCFQKIMHVFF